MARFRGTVQGGLGEASRPGHATYGLVVRAQSYSGDVKVEMYARGDLDCVRIWVTDHGVRALNSCVVLYEGPVEQLLNQSARKTMLSAFASEMLTDAAV